MDWKDKENTDNRPGALAHLIDARPGHGHKTLCAYSLVLSKIKLIDAAPDKPKCARCLKVFSAPHSRINVAKG